MSFDNRIIGSDRIPPDQLMANPNNWRVHPKHQQESLNAALSEVGWVQQVIVNQRTGHMLDGHLRVQLAMRNDEAAVPVLYVDLSEEEEALMLAVLDPIAGLAGADKNVLDGLLRNISTGDAVLQGLIDDIAVEAGLFSERSAGGGEDNATDPLGTIIQYNLVFDEDEQRDVFFGFLKWLKGAYEGETVAERMVAFIHDQGYSETD